MGSRLSDPRTRDMNTRRLHICAGTVALRPARGSSTPKINAHNDRAPFDYRFIQQYAEADAEVVVRFDIKRAS